MSKTVRGDQKHLTEENREYIEAALKRHLTFKEMARFLGKDPTTISKEIKKHRALQAPSNFNGESRNLCVYVKTCQKRNLCETGNCKYPCRQCGNCNTICKDFVKITCQTTQKAPFVCNGCDSKTSCRLEKYYYRSAKSQREYKVTLVSSREGINMTSSEFEELDTLISPLVKRGQSIAHICAAHDGEIPCTERTVYNYFDRNLFTAINIDLPRKVRYKKRKVHKKKEPCEYNVRENRTYEDFQKFIAENPDLSIVEMDTVEGRIGGKTLLTFLIRSCRLLLAYLMDDCRQASVIAAFERIYEALGDALFRKIFGVILTDNGKEFLDRLALELDKNSNERTTVFYCDPYSSYQKGMLEKNHEYIRYILPKGTSFDDLTQEDVDLMISHINSSNRDSLNRKSPYAFAEFILPQFTLEKLSIKKVSPDEVLLKPRLLN